MGTKCPKCGAENPDTSTFCADCGSRLLTKKDIDVTKTTEIPKQKLTTGSTFGGRYQIIEELGHGGMGKVYKVNDTEIKEKIALKLLKPEIAADDKTIERFRNEMKFARRIVHKNVGRMFDLGKAEGTYFITMEYVPGQDLKVLIRQTGKLAVETTLSVARQVCEGLSEAHSQGVIHRDLKPGNVMIDKQGNAKIMDFGIARSLVEKDREITGAGVVIGTPVYMSPEQAEAKELDSRSDIYSLGVILYEMLTGRCPFEGDTSLIIALKHKGEPPQDPRELNPQIPEALSRLILKCLERNKENRFQNAQEISSELDVIKKDYTTTDRIKTAAKPQTVEISKAKLRRMILIFGAVAAAVILVMLGFILFSGGQDAIDSVAILPFENVKDSPEAEYLCNGITESLINQLSQVEGLKVMARYSVFRYKGKNIDPQQIGRELGVGAVLVGRVDLRDQSLIVGAELVHVEEGTQIWGNRFESRNTEISNIEESLVNTIADKLRLKLSPQDIAQLSSRYPRNSEAYNLYLKGMYLVYGTPEEMDKALEYFRQATELDPGFALPYAGLANAYSTQALLTTMTRQKALPLAKAALQTALELDDNLAEAHTAAGEIKFRFDWDWQGAEEELRHGIRLNPGSSEGHLQYGIFLCLLLRLEEAMAEAKKAQELDPLAISPSHWVGATYYVAQDYESAIREFQKIFEFHPDWYWGYIKLATSYAGMNDIPKALEAAQKAEGLIGGVGSSLARAWLANVYAKCGETERAEDALSWLLEREKEQHVDSYCLAEIYGALGKTDLALDRLKRAYDERSPNIIYLKVFAQERFKNLSSEPVYQELLRRMTFR